MKKVKITLLVTLTAALFSCKNTNKETTNTASEDTIKTEINGVPSQPKIEFPDLKTTYDLLELNGIVKKVVKQIDETRLKKKLTFIRIYKVSETPLTIWYENNSPIRIKCGAANDAGEITGFVNYYLKDGKLWYVGGIFANYLFENGKLKYWLNENWQDNNVSKTEIDNREKYLKTQVKQFIAKLEGETIFYDEEKREWVDSYGKCNTCTFRNGFNPNGWLLTDAERSLALDVLKAEKMYSIDLKHNRITTKEMLENLLAEVEAETEQDQEYEIINVSELNQKLTLQKENLTAKEVMELYYPHKVDKNAEGNESISISEPYTHNGFSFLYLIHNNLLDDSVQAIRYEMTLTKKDNRWTVTSLKKNWECWKGRGHTSWGIEQCN